MQKESQRHNGKGRAKTSLKNIPLTLFVTFVCERELETEQRLHYIDLTSPFGHSRVSFSFSWAAQAETWGPSLLAFSTASYHQLVWSPTPSGVPRVPSAGCGFPYHILSLTRLISNSIQGPESPLRQAVAFSTTSCLRLLWSTHGLPVFTELYNSSIAHSVFGTACLIVIKRK